MQSQERNSHDTSHNVGKEELEIWQDYLRTDYRQMQEELDEIDRNQTQPNDSIQALRIQIDSELESTIQELGELQAQLPKEQSASLFQQCADNALKEVRNRFALTTAMLDPKQTKDSGMTHNIQQENYTSNNNAISAETKVSGKIALHSVIGIILHDLIQGVMIETRMLMKESDNKSWKEIFMRFKDRLQTIWADLKEKWKDIIANSFEAAILNFFSHIIISMTNALFIVIKEMAQIISSGFKSLYRAIKILAKPPKDMPKDDVMREAAKVLVSGLIAAATMLGAAALGKMIETTFPFLALPLPFTEGETIASAAGLCLTAALGAILSTIAIYYIDKWASDSKESRLQLQIMGKSGEIVQLKTAQSWFVLHDAWQFTLGITQSTINKINEAQEAIAKSSQETKESFDDLDSTMAKLRAFRMQHN